MHVKKSLATGALAVGFVVGALALSKPAAADVACNSAGECWNTHRYELNIYPPDVGVRVYDDKWREEHRADAHYRWMKEHDPDRGYYYHGEWHEIR